MQGSSGKGLNGDRNRFRRRMGSTLLSRYRRLRCDSRNDLFCLDRIGDVARDEKLSSDGSVILAKIVDDRRRKD
jgi:hypothetical protein